LLGFSALFAETVTYFSHQQCDLKAEQLDSLKKFFIFMPREDVKMSNMDSSLQLLGIPTPT